jgi:hypothetical protein
MLSTSQQIGHYGALVLACLGVRSMFLSSPNTGCLGEKQLLKPA